MRGLPVFLRKDRAHILQRFAGRGTTTASYLRCFLSPFTPYLLCYTCKARMVTIMPPGSKSPRGRQTASVSAASLPAGRGNSLLGPSPAISSLLCKSQGPEPVFLRFLRFFAGSVRFFRTFGSDGSEFHARWQSRTNRPSRELRRSRAVCEAQPFFCYAPTSRSFSEDRNRPPAITCSFLCFKLSLFHLPIKKSDTVIGSELVGVGLPCPDLPVPASCCSIRK